MVHVRLNERETNPNPHVNFISALDVGDDASQEDARQFLRALAAQVRPVMKSHGFVVNSLEEYEHNMVFAGRNWNSGETVELVLRRPDGSFQHPGWLMSVLCHELAHIKHMNHGPAFQALWKRLRAEVRVLQDEGYYGDGYWSSGTRLRDSAQVTGDGVEGGEFPEYLCGGAQKRTRPTAHRRKRRARQPRPGAPIASNKTGRQTEKKRKAGARVKSKVAFSGGGSMLVEGIDQGDEGTGFRKQAGRKRAREERALAAERRIRALQAASQQASTSKDSHSKSDSEDDTSEEEVDELEGDDEDEVVRETDTQRRQTLHRSERLEDLLALDETSWRDFENEFIFTGHKAKRSSEGIIDISSDDDIPVASGSTFVMPPPKKSPDHSKDSKTGLGNMVQSEISLRKKESLGMAPVKARSRVLGGGIRDTQKEPEWACHVCTLLNRESFLACSACSTPRAPT
ncbi:WLM domain-containing protein [Mycena capillaripes]|nr:WLM domain-containing protein [Mycena capillaripes]